MKLNHIACMDALAYLQSLPDNSVDCCVTSPPYYGLRDYGVDGQLGLEPTLKAYIDKLVVIFEELRRVLKPSGTFWLNLGDSYNGSSKGHILTDNSLNKNRPASAISIKTDDVQFKPKDLMLVPHRVAIALQDAGWWVRMDNVWSKPNPMPESVTDRPTKAHEYVFLLTKSEHYFYDADAIREEYTRNWQGETRNANYLNTLYANYPSSQTGLRNMNHKNLGGAN